MVDCGLLGRSANCRLGFDDRRGHAGEEKLNGFHHSILNVRDCHGNSDGMGIPGEEKASEGWSRPLREGGIESFRYCLCRILSLDSGHR